MLLWITKEKRIGKDDLRFKIMQKNMSCQAQTNDLLNGMDLREKLSRTVKLAETNVHLRKPGPETKTVKHAETNVDLWKPWPETKETNLWSQIPSRSAEVLSQTDLTRSYHAWSLDQLKQRYPAGFFGSTGSLFPQMNVEKLQKRPIIQKYDDVRSAPLTTNNILDPPGCMSTTPLMRKSKLLTGCAKPVAPMQAHVQPSSNIVQKNPYIVQATYLLTSIFFNLYLTLQHYIAWKLNLMFTFRIY